MSNAELNAQLFMVFCSHESESPSSQIAAPYSVSVVRLNAQYVMVKIMAVRVSYVPFVWLETTPMSHRSGWPGWEVGCEPTLFPIPPGLSGPLNKYPESTLWAKPLDVRAFLHMDILHAQPESVPSEGRISLSTPWMWPQA